MIAERLVPKNVADLSAIVQAHNRQAAALRIEGGNTLHALGNDLDAPAATLSVLKIDGLIAHEYHDMTCSVRCGTRIAALDSALGERGQFVPFDVPMRTKATVGGTLAAGWLGARRHMYARTRDLVIGSQVVLGDGTVVNAGGMVVKNVTGYDMSKLYVGSLGTLGIIVQANFKTLPLPPSARILVAPLPEGTRERAVAAIASMRAMPAAAICVEGFRKNVDGEDGVDGRMLILLEGTAPAVDRATREVRSALGRAGVPDTTIVDTNARGSFERTVDACIAELGERSVTFRELGDPGSAEERARRARDAAHTHELFTDVWFDVMNGNVFLRVSERDSRAFAEKLERFDDDLRMLAPGRTIVAGSAAIRSQLDPWGSLPSAIEKMRALKAQFDPGRILNPGRFVGRI